MKNYIKAQFYRILKTGLFFKMLFVILVWLIFVNKVFVAYMELDFDLFLPVVLWIQNSLLIVMVLVSSLIYFVFTEMAYDVPKTLFAFGMIKKQYVLSNFIFSVLLGFITLLVSFILIYTVYFVLYGTSINYIFNQSLNSVLSKLFLLLLNLCEIIAIMVTVIFITCKFSACIFSIIFLFVLNMVLEIVGHIHSNVVIEKLLNNPLHRIMQLDPFANESFANGNGLILIFQSSCISYIALFITIHMFAKREF